MAEISNFVPTSELLTFNFLQRLHAVWSYKERSYIHSELHAVWSIKNAPI